MDVTVADTIANFYLISTSVTAGSAAELAASRKKRIMSIWSLCTLPYLWLSRPLVPFV